MYKAKVNKSSNRDRILECIYRNPKISRKEISDLTGITPATVTTTVAAMVKEGIVTELGQVEEDRGTIGRSRIALDVNGACGCVLGVEFTLTALTVCATDLHGGILYADSIPYTPQLSADITAQIIQTLERCIRVLGLPTEKILGIGIAVPGHIIRDSGRLVCSSGTWNNFNAHAIRAAFPCPVVFENNVRCMAVSRYLHAPLETPSSFALFHIGKGMFCANVTDDELHLDTTYGSGEIAHTIVIPDGKQCECGKRGCLQTVATDAALLENSAIIFHTDASSLLHNYAQRAEDLTIEHIAIVYTLGDPAVRRLVTQMLRYICMASLNIAILMNPEKLFLHGNLFNYESIRRDLLNMISEQFDFTKNNYRLGTVEFIACRNTDGAVGAAAYAILKSVVHV